jgi:hypothetical protein
MTLWMAAPLYDERPTIPRVIHTFITMVINTSDNAQVCRQLLANFFAGIKSVPMRWFPIILRGASSSNTNVHGLSLLMALDYNDTYLPLVKTCGLIIKQSINIKEKGATLVISPSICHGRSNQLNYTWDDFIAEFCLPLEVLHLYLNKQKTYFVRVGEFKDQRFTIQDQLKGKMVRSPQLYFGGCRNQQLKLVNALAAVEL